MDSGTMSYCTNQDIIDLTGTDLSIIIIDRIIEGADRKVNRILRENGLTTNPSPVPDDVKDASIYFAAAVLLYRHMVDGTLPAQYKAGELLEQYDVKTVIYGYRTDAEHAISLYVEDQKPAVDLNIVRIVGQDGESTGVER